MVGGKNRAGNGCCSDPGRCRTGRSGGSRSRSDLRFYNEFMGTPESGRHAGLRLVWVWLLLLLPSNGRPARGQIQEPSQFPPPQGPTGMHAPPFGSQQDPNEDPSTRRAREESARRRNIDRQRRIVADSDKLLQLAQELKEEIDQSGRDTPPQAAKKADEIEKLARSVKDRMRSE